MEKPAKVLIVEDHNVCRRVVAEMLRKSGHEVVEARNGSEALQALQQPDAPKLMILDWLMPEMDGPEVLRRVRVMHTDRPPYIIMLTNQGQKDHVIAALGAGANDYLTKPFDPDELLVRVEVGGRIVEMQLRQHRQRVNAQRFRVKAHQVMDELHSTLAAKDIELRQLQGELRGMAHRLQVVREERAGISRELQDSVGHRLSVLRIDLLGMDHHLRTANTSEQAVLSLKVSAMMRSVECLTERTQTMCSSLMAGV